MTVAVVGLGRAGLPLACLLVESGEQVFGIDVDQSKVDMINCGENPYPDEPGIGRIIDRFGSDELYATTGYDVDVDTYIIIVPVGLTEDNKPDLSVLESAVRSVGRVLNHDHLVVVETTVPVGTTENEVRNWLEEESGMVLGDFYLAHSPERVMAGMAMSRLRTFSKIIGGVNSASGLKAHVFYSRCFPDVRLAPSSRYTELAKIAEGCYRDVNIALANELYIAAATYNIDYGEVARLANHEFCHLHQAGIGVGGHCIPVYPHFLISDPNIARPTFLETGRCLNDWMVQYWANRILFEAEYRSDVRICIHEIGYRPGSRLTTNSRAIELYFLLIGAGYDVYVYDDEFTPAEVAELGLRWIALDEADFIFNTGTLEITHV